MPIDPNSVKWDSLPDPKAVQWDDSPSFMQALKEQAVNLGMGALRGAGSIGATLLSPIDSAARAVGIQNDYVGRNDRREQLDAGATSLTGSDPNSFAYKLGKVVTEVAGTAGAGGAVANVASKVVPGVARVAPELIQAIRTGGMDAAGGGMVTRTAGGAINGAASAGMINREDAGSGAVIGGVAPTALRGVAAVGERIGDIAGRRYADALRQFQANAPARETLQDATQAGYVVPPASVNPSFTNRMLETISGKQSTQQLASTTNADVTERLVRQALGMADNQPLSRGSMESLRRTAGTAYSDVGGLSPQAAADLEALKQARNDSQAWFKAYNRSASPADLAQARQFRSTSEQLEQALEGYAQDAGRPELIPALRDARRQIEKTYTVERALNDASGTVDARVLGRMYENGTPLTDELRTVGRFASAYPTVNKTAQQIGSPDTHNLRFVLSALMGGGTAAVGGPAGIAAAAIPYAAPPLARALMFRQGAQQALVPQAPQAGNIARLAELLRNQDALEAAARAAPAIGVSRSP